jgi:hypothetical protein
VKKSLGHISSCENLCGNVQGYEYNHANKADEGKTK